jgi:hypothetical protein
MDKKNTGLIATIATAILCGCPGLFGLCMGAMFAVVGAIPGSDIDVMGSSDPSAAIGTGLGMLCLGVIFVAIPIIVGVVTLRKPKDESPAVVDVQPTDAPPVEPAKEAKQPASPAETVISQPRPPEPPSEKPAKPADDEPLPPAS